MFDYVKCQRVMPDGFDGVGVEFQSKDFDCTMETLTITPEGRLVRDEWHFEDVPKAEHPYPDAPDGDIRSLCGVIRRVVDRANVDTNYHGYLNFYACGPRGDDWHEYNAKFTDGKLVCIDVVASQRLAEGEGR